MIARQRLHALLSIAALLFVAACFASCGGDEPTRDYGRRDFQDASPVEPAANRDSETTKSSPPTNSTSGASLSGFAGKTKFKGTDTFSIKPMPDGAKLVDGSEQELARYTIKDELRVKAKNQSDRELGQIKGAATKIHIEQPGGVRVFALQRQADGDYKLETAAGELVNKIKKRDYGWKIEDAAGKEIAKVKSKSGKTSLRDASDKTILSTKNAISPLAMACLALDQIERPLRVALAIRMQAEGN